MVVPVSMEDVGPGTRDPFLSLLVRQDPEKGDAFCRTPMRLYDGRRLARLNPEDMEGAPFVTAPGHIACRVRWEPIAGYPEKTYERAGDMRPVNRICPALPIADLWPRELSVARAMARFALWRSSYETMQVVPAKLELPPQDDDEDDEVVSQQVRDTCLPNNGFGKGIAMQQLVTPRDVNPQTNHYRTIFLSDIHLGSLVSGGFAS